MVTIEELVFHDGLIPAVVRDASSGDVLTLAWMNEAALRRTLDTGETWFWSRSRNELWNKGATSGNRQRVIDIAADCDRDALLVTVEPAGPACHTGTRSCFRGAQAAAPAPFAPLMTTLRDRFARRPPDSYSASLFSQGADRILKKVVEETTEVVIAAKAETRERLVSEIADLVFHLSVLMVNETVDWSDVVEELRRRG